MTNAIPLLVMARHEAIPMSRGIASSIAIGGQEKRVVISRRAELWSGIGVASTYAGGVALDYLPQLLALSGQYRLDYLSGIPFSAKMRQQGGNYSQWTESACRLILNASTDEVADIAGDLEKQLNEANDITDITLMKSAYDLIRTGIKERINKKFKVEGEPPLASIS